MHNSTLAAFSKIRFHTIIKHLLIYSCIILFLSSCKVKYTIIEKDNKFGCINKKGEEFIPVKYENLFYFKYNLAAAKIDGKWGYVNKKNEMIIDPVFRVANSFHENLAAVAKDSLFGFINTKGEKKIDYKFLDVSFGFSEELCNVYINQDSSGYINKKGELIFCFKNAICYPFKKGIAEIWLNYESDSIIGQNAILINKKGKVKYDKNLPVKSRWIPGSFFPHIYLKNGKQGLLNRFGDTLTGANYDCMASIIEGRIIYRVADKWGVMNKKGVIIVAPSFEEINHFFCGMAKFKMNNKWGYINRKGKIIIEPTFDNVGDFHYGLASVSKNGKLCFINKKGNLVLETDYEFNYNCFVK